MERPLQAQAASYTRLVNHNEAWSTVATARSVPHMAVFTILARSWSSSRSGSTSVDVFTAAGARYSQTPFQNSNQRGKSTLFPLIRPRTTMPIVTTACSPKQTKRRGSIYRPLMLPVKGNERKDKNFLDRLIRLRYFGSLEVLSFFVAPFWHADWTAVRSQANA